MKHRLLQTIALELLLTVATITFCHPANPGYGGTFAAAIAQVSDAALSSLYINKITYSCDTPLGEDEFFYLTKLKYPGFITKNDVDKAYKFLLLKQRFSSISIDLIDGGTTKGKCLHFTLISNWIFKKLEFEGVLFGKPQYFNLYLQQPGEVFDAHLHEDSLAAIQRHLHEQGYFGCQITDEIIYSQKQKTITAQIKVKKKRVYSIKRASVDFADLEQQYSLMPNNNEINILAADIKTKFHSLAHTTYSQKQILKIIKKIKLILKKAGFFNPHLKLTRRIMAKHPLVDLILHVQYGKRKFITLEGNTVFSDDHIREEFLDKDVPDWLFYPDIITQQLLHEYYKKGYWHARIKPRETQPSKYHFAIKEGIPALIELVEVIDSITHLPETTTTMINDLLKDKHCDQNILDDALERLKNSYVVNGFWDFSIIDKQFIKNKVTGRYVVKISINKGTQRLWGGFSIEGFNNLEQSEFFKKYHAINTHAHVPFNLYWIQEQRLFLLHYFQKLGHWYADVIPELIILPDTKKIIAYKAAPLKVFARWKIKQGPCVKLGKTILRGATTVAFDRIKKQLAFKEGDDWNREKLERSRKKLKQLDVFKTIQVQPHQLSRTKSKKPVIITLVDDDPVELRARAGYFINSKNILFKQQSTPKVGASFIIKNPTNRADRISAVGDWTKFERTFALDYQQPSPFGISAMSIFRGYANKFINPVQVRNSGSAYQATQYGFLAGLHEEYKNDYHWAINAGNEWIKITRAEGNIKFDKNLLNTFLPYFFVEPRLEIDKTDNRINTTKGWLGAFSIKGMIPENNGAVTAKCVGDVSAYYPLHEKFILAGHLRFGHIFRSKFEKIPPNERFYLGGPNSVRGYDPDALPPYGVSEKIVKGKLCKQYTIQGGASMFNANLEFRFPIYKSFGAVLFQDVGILSQSGFLGFKDRWYPGTGLGFRYKTPIGSIRFDIGWRWKKLFKEDHKSYAWYLTIGEAF